MPPERRRRRHRKRHSAEHEDEERWLLTYADMITLLMALFIVMYAISNVNKSKLKVLSQSLNEAFSGAILPGGETIQRAPVAPSPTPNAPAPPQFQTPITITSPTRKQQEDDLARVKRSVDAYVSRRHLENQVQTLMVRRGLVVRLLTDKLLFDSGEAAVKPVAQPLLNELARILRLAKRRQIAVEGHTDSTPISSATFPSNWELSTARASGVVRELISDGMPAGLLQASGFAYQRPLETNSTVGGRARNRRVEIIVLRGGIATPSVGVLQ